MNTCLLYTSAKQVFLASDPDREGEAISWHLAHILNLDAKEKNRVVFNEITDVYKRQGIHHAPRNPLYG